MPQQQLPQAPRGRERSPAVLGTNRQSCREGSGGQAGAVTHQSHPAALGPREASAHRPDRCQLLLRHFTQDFSSYRGFPWLMICDLPIIADNREQNDSF